MSVYKRKGQKNYWISFTYKGREVSKSARTTNKKTAETLERKWKDEIIRSFELGEAESITTSTALDNYQTKKEGGSDIVNVRAFVRFVKKNLNTSTDLENLSTVDVNRLRRIKESTGVSQGSIAHMFTFIRGTINHAKEMGYKIPTIEYPTIKRTKHRLRFLSVDEEKRLLQALIPRSANHIQRQQDNHDLVVFLLDTGCRYGEACRLEWKDVDFQKRQILLYRPKVRNESILAIPNRLFEVLNRRYKDNPAATYIFTTRDGTGHRKSAPKGINDALKRSGIADATIHTLRHSFASRMAQAGLSLYEISQLLGHTDIATSAIYSHLIINDVSTKAAGILNDINQQKTANLKVVN